MQEQVGDISLGSMASAGMPFRAASSSRSMHSPVLPDPVMPTTTAWVVRSSVSYSRGCSPACPVCGS